MFKFASVLLWGLIVTFSYAFQQELRIYSETDQKGYGLLLRTKEPDTSAFKPINFSNTNSWCCYGYWFAYTGINYTGALTTRDGHWDMEVCHNQSWLSSNSVRHLGPSDSTVPSISLYEFSDTVGRELIIDGPALTNLPFRPNSLFTTALSKWTLFSGDNFSGTASCYISPAQMHVILNLNSSFVIGSVLRGCLTRRIDTYIYANDLEIRRE